MTEIEIGRGKRGRRAYAFDDIAIVPSRRTRDPEDVDITWDVDAYKFELPMMAAAMDGVVSPATAVQRENALRDLVRVAADEIATPIVQRTGGSLDPAGLDGIVAEITSAVYGEMARW